MKHNTIILSVVIVLAGALFVPNLTASATERAWIIPDGAGYGPSTAYLKVNFSDNVAVNWTSGSGGDNWILYFTTSALAINWSNNIVEYTNLAHYQYQLDLRSLTAPQTAWIRFGSNDVVRVDIPYQSGRNNIVNFTVSHAPDPMANRIDELAQQIIELAASLRENLSLRVADLTSGIAALNASLRENISDRNDELWSEIEWLSSNIGRLQRMIETVNGSLTTFMETSQDNDTMLIGSTIENITNLSVQLLRLNVSLSEKLSQVPQYNDTLIRQQLDNLSDIQPVVEYQNFTNLTLVNQTLVNQTLLNTTEINPINYTNTTKSVSQDNLVAPVMAIAIGEAAIGAGLVYYLRRKNGLMKIPPPEG